MSNVFVFLAMVFCHIVDDYYLQGCLALMKQISWWKEHAPQDLYKHDYVMALAMHSMSWSFMIMLPISINMSFQCGLLFLVLFIINACVHFAVDDLKANKGKINLITDQIIHIAQIVVTFIIMVR